MNQKVLKEEYESAGFPSGAKLWSIIKYNRLHKKLKITQADVMAFVKKQKVAQVHGDKRVAMGHITATQPFAKVQGDLVDYQPYAKQNGGMRFMLIVCDVFTRQAFAEAIKNKKPETVAAAMNRIMKSENVHPLIFTTDNGNEFMGKPFQLLLDKNNVRHDPNEVGDHRALGVIDRFTKTIKNMIRKWMTHKNSVKWTTVYKKFVDKYNDTPHEGLLGIAPEDAELPEYTPGVSLLNQEKAKITTNVQKKRKLVVGDKVRVRLKKTLFTKGFEKKFSDRTFTIRSVSGVIATLSDGRDFNFKHLKKVDVDDATDVVDEVKRVKKDHQVTQTLKSEGLSSSNIFEGKRTRATKEEPVLRMSTRSQSKPKPEPKPKPKPKPKPQKKTQEEEKFIVEKFLKRKKIKNKLHFFVKWKGYPASQSTWEPRSQLIEDLGLKQVSLLQSQM